MAAACGTDLLYCRTTKAIQVPRAATSPIPAAADPVSQTRAAASPWSTPTKVKRVLWMMVHTFLFRPSFHNFYGWRRFILRRFGATIGRDVRIRPTARIEFPWNLEVGDRSVVGDFAILYSLGRITLGRDTTVSQYAHLCAGTHDYTRPNFNLLCPPIRGWRQRVDRSRCVHRPGMNVGDRAVVAARATVVRDVPADQVVAGNPACQIKPRATRVSRCVVIQIVA